MKPRLGHPTLHVAFKASLVFKGLLGVIEIASGVFVASVDPKVADGMLRAFARKALRQDPRDALVHYLFHLAQRFSISQQHFAAAYR